MFLTEPRAPKNKNEAQARTIAASIVTVFLLVALIIFVLWWIRRRQRRIQPFPPQILPSASAVQLIVRIPEKIGVAALGDVKAQAEVAGTAIAQRVALDETQPDEGAPARTHNQQLMDFSDVPAEQTAAQASNAQDTTHTQERLRRVEEQLAALLIPPGESQELPPSYWR
jgi:hypothetical protein